LLRVYDLYMQFEPPFRNLTTGVCQRGYGACLNLLTENHAYKGKDTKGTKMFSLATLVINLVIELISNPGYEHQTLQTGGREVRSENDRIGGKMRCGSRVKGFLPLEKILRKPMNKTRSKQTTSWFSAYNTDKHVHYYYYCCYCYSQRHCSSHEYKMLCFHPFSLKSRD